MEVDARATLRALLTGCRVLAMAVSVDDAPHAGLLPFVARPDLSGLLVHVSALARHARGLNEGAACGVVIHEPDSDDADPLQLPRVTLQCRVRHLVKGGPRYDEAREQYLARFPGSARTFGLADFELFELLAQSGRLVTGFAKAANIGPKTLRGLAP